MASEKERKKENKIVNQPSDTVHKRFKENSGKSEFQPCRIYKDERDREKCKHTCTVINNKIPRTTSRWSLRPHVVGTHNKIHSFVHYIGICTCGKMFLRYVYYYYILICCAPYWTLSTSDRCFALQVYDCRMVPHMLINFTGF